MPRKNVGLRSLPDESGDEELGRWLRQEAAGAMPAFSETLHRRIVAAIASRRAGADATVPAPPGRRWRQLRWAYALAGAGAVCAVLLGWRLQTLRQRANDEQRSAVGLDAASDPVAGWINQTIDRFDALGERRGQKDWLIELTGADDLASAALASLDRRFGPAKLGLQPDDLERGAQRLRGLLRPLPIDLATLGPSGDEAEAPRRE